MPGTLRDKEIAFLVADGFDATAFDAIRGALGREGAKAAIVGPHSPLRTDGPGRSVEAAVTLASAAAAVFDGLVLVDGAESVERLRAEPEALAFIRAFFEHYKPVAALGPAALLLADSAVLAGRVVTSERSLRAALERAGARWVDRDVVVYRRLVTSRDLGDLDRFCLAVVQQFALADLQSAHPDAAE